MPYKDIEMRRKVAREGMRKLRAKRSDDKIRPFMDELVGHQGVSMEEFKTHYAPMLKKFYHAYELMAELEAETKLRRMGLVRFDHRGVL